MPELLIKRKTSSLVPGKHNGGFGIILNAIQQNMLFRLYKYYIIESVLIVRRDGFRKLMRQRGGKFLFVIFTYYLVRDAFVYVFIPYCIARGIF